MLNQLRDEVHKNAIEHGWWEKEREFGTLVALMHSELSEALEEWRNGRKPDEVYFSCTSSKNIYDGVHCGEECDLCTGGKPEGIPIELADCIIRILDYCGAKGIDIEEAIQIKHEYNKNRPYRHGGKQV